MPEVPAPITDDSTIAQYWREKYPDTNYCNRCGYPWQMVSQHPTPYSTKMVDGNIEVVGCFPLCERCWRILGTYEERMPYYVGMWEWWAANDRAISADEKIDIAQSVKAQSILAE